MQNVTRVVVGILAALLSLLLVLFGVQNTEPVSIQLLGFATEQLSLSLVVIGAAIVGATIVWLISLWGWARQSLRNRRDQKERSVLQARTRELEQRVATLEAENVALRARGKPAEPAKTNEAARS